MKKYTLTNWTMENHQSIFGAFVLRGLLQGHPTIKDGTEVRTTAVTSMDNEAGIAYTHHSGCFQISNETMSAGWRTATEGNFLQDSFEQAPFQDEQTDGSNDGLDGDDLTGDGSNDGLDGDTQADGGDDLTGDGSNDGLDGDTSDADLGGLPPGLLALLQGMDSDDALAGDDSLSDDAPAPKRSRKAKSVA